MEISSSYLPPVPGTPADPRRRAGDETSRFEARRQEASERLALPPPQKPEAAAAAPPVQQVGPTLRPDQVRPEPPQPGLSLLQARKALHAYGENARLGLDTSGGELVGVDDYA